MRLYFSIVIGQKSSSGIDLRLIPKTKGQGEKFVSRVSVTPRNIDERLLLWNRQPISCFANR